MAGFIKEIDMNIEVPAPIYPPLCQNEGGEIVCDLVSWIEALPWGNPLIMEEWLSGNVSGPVGSYNGESYEYVHVTGPFVPSDDSETGSVVVPDSDYESVAPVPLPDSAFGLIFGLLCLVIIGMLFKNCEALETVR